MICPNCSSEIEDGSLFCSECGVNLMENIKSKSLNYGNQKIGENIKVSKGAKIAVIIAILGCISAFIAANEIGKAAIDMISLRSQSGTSLAEVYYQDVGKALDGFAVFCRAFGVSSLAITIAIVFRKQ